MSKHFLSSLVILLCAIPVFAFSANIDSTNKYARFLDGDDRINFNPSNGGATVTATSVTGYVWGENAGWINLNPTNGGVTNDGSGNLSGYAWGENTGWINFNPTNGNGGVSISCTGEFSGYGWSERRGWIVFNCSTDSSCSNLNHKVVTTWTFSCSADDDDDGGGGGGGSPGGGPQPACSDNRDNDLDGLVDRFDHACHTDGDPTNFNSYSPLINNENARPILARVGLPEVSLIVGSAYVDSGAVATDAEDGNITSQITNTAQLVNTNVVGDYVVIYNVFDSSGLLALPITRIVKVIPATPPPSDNTPPQITLASFPIITIHVGDNFSEPGFTAVDNEDGDITSVVLVSTEVETDVVGSYIITYKVTDSGGLTDMITRIVDVIPKNVPLPPPPGEEVPPPDEGVPNVPPPETRPDGENIFFPPGPVPDFVAPVVTLVDEPIGRIIPWLGLILGFLATALSFLGATGRGSEIILLPARIWSWLLSFFGLRKRYRPWGTVYDSITKQPLDPAYVTLIDQSGNEIATSITDIDGRYGFLAPSGTYTLKAQKTNYMFPSERLKGKTNDELYQNLYFGEPIELKDKEGVVARNIPMDPTNFDWNEFAKKDHKVMHLYSKFDPILTRASDIFFYVGLMVSIFAFYVLPAPYNTIIFGLYIVMLILRVMGLRPRFNGKVIDGTTKKPLSFALVRVHSPELALAGQSEIAKRVCDALGRYYLLVPIGSYSISVEKKNEDGTYSHVYTSPVFYARKGIINKTFKI